MAIPFQFPKGIDAIEYLASFQDAFGEQLEMRSALLGVEDSLRQARLLIGEPLGRLACLTAEEEAASFLYYALVAKGYSVPLYGKLYDHKNKLKFLVFAVVMQQYFFPANRGGAIRVERDGQRPKTSYIYNVGDFQITQEDVLESIGTSGKGKGAHDTSIDAAVNKVLQDIVPNGYTFKSHIKNVANRRNRCLYGDPANKLRLQTEHEILHFKNNCVSMLVFGFLVFNSRSPTVSMKKLVTRIFEKISK